MSYDTELSHRKYHRLFDLASLWRLDVFELLRIALERGVGIAIYEIRGTDQHLADATEGDESPSWAVFVTPDVLKTIASVGKAHVGGGVRFNQPETTTPVFFPERQLTAEDLIVLPDAYAELAKIVDGDQTGAVQPVPEMTLASRNTLLKQIAALAILLSKQQERFIHGDRPNGSGIATAIEKAIATWPAETCGKLEQGFFSTSKINESIREGLKLIGFKETDGGK